MAAMREGRMVPVSLDEVTAGLKLVKENDELVVAAKSLGTSFGV